MFGRLFDLSPAEARARADELLERFDLADAADRPARTYSGGMRRRLDLASSLLTGRAILFLDEPTTGLDPRSRNADLGDRARARPRGNDAAAHDPVPRGGRRARRPDRGHRPRQGDRRGHGQRAQGPGRRAAARGRARQRRPARQARRALAAIGCGDPEPERAAGPAHAAGAAGRPGDDRGRSLGAAPGRDRGQRPRPAPPDARRRLPAAHRRAAERERRRAEVDQRRPRARPPAGGRGRACAPERHGASRLRAPVAGSGCASPPTRRRRRHRAQPAPLRPPAAAADLLDHPADHVRAAVRLRVRRRDQGLAARAASPTSTSCCRASSSSPSPSGPRRRRSASSEDLERGVVDRFRSMPMARSAVLVGRTIADLVRNIADHRPDDRRRLHHRLPLPGRASPRRSRAIAVVAPSAWP